MDIEILHKEKSFVICIKKPGVLSEETDGTYPGMTDLLRAQLGSEVYPVHRLDREAGGVMVYALTKPAAAKFSAMVSGGALGKRYVIIVHGKPEAESGTMEDLLFKDSRKNKSFVVKRERKGVKKAVLDYRTVCTKNIGGEDYSLIDVSLRTGRTHQIRVQFSSRGMPVCGDSRYGSRINGEMCLFSRSIEFENPFNGENCIFSAVPSGGLFEEFGECIAKED